MLPGCCGCFVYVCGVDGGGGGGAPASAACTQDYTEITFAKKVS